MIFLIVVTNGYVLVTLIGAKTENHDFCFALLDAVITGPLLPVVEIKESVISGSNQTTKHYYYSQIYQTATDTNQSKHHWWVSPP